MESFFVWWWHLFEDKAGELISTHIYMQNKYYHYPQWECQLRMVSGELRWYSHGPDICREMSYSKMNSAEAKSQLNITGLAQPKKKYSLI